MFLRTCTADGGRSMNVATTDGGSSRLVNRIVDEGDLALLGARVMQTSGIYGDDKEEVPAAMRQAYRSMRRDQGGLASPVAATYLGLQSRDAFDTVVIDPASNAGPDAAKPSSAVIFLHGYAGNFEMPCWQIAQAVAGLDVVTACPSTRWIGDWWSSEGEAILKSTVAMLRARGISRFVLAGLSNGGYGASELAPRMKGTFAGVILISGAFADQPSAGVPVLLVHGTNDNVAPVSEARSYAAKHPGCKLVELHAGHFALLVRAEKANRAIHDFVAETLVARASR
jgi:pimeloyl-ACP methyl ester carboxylesterase